MRVDFDGVAQSFGRTRVFDDLSWSLGSGITALLGVNGAGKTTLMRILATALVADRGKVSYDDQVLSSRRELSAVRSKIGYLAQSFGYDPRFTVEEHVTYLAWCRGMGGKGRASAVQEAIEYVDLADSARTRMGSLSGGMRQRAGIAGAVVGHPELLILDEPTVGLDPQQREHFRRLISDAPAQTVLLSTHMTDDVDLIADHVSVLHGGRVLADEPADTFSAGYASTQAAYLALISPPADETLG